jgi:hypothetical protein
MTQPWCGKPDTAIAAGDKRNLALKFHVSPHADLLNYDRNFKVRV